MKKIFFYTVLFAINYAAIELVSYGVYRVKFGDYSRQELQLERIQFLNCEVKATASTEASYTPNDALVKEILHPYVGYNLEVSERTDDCGSQDCRQRVMVEWDRPFPKRSDDKLIVAILGGSVAAGTIYGTSEFQYYQQLLGALPEYQGREVVLFGLAVAGYRQPQQLMLLNYYYSLGAEFDLIINLDGFNDMAIPVIGHINHKLHPSFPRSWEARVATTVSQKLVSLYADKKNLQAQQLAAARFMSNPWSRNSPLSNLLWKIKHGRYLNQVSLVDQNISSVSLETGGHSNYEKLGPNYDFTDWDSLYSYTVDMWANSSQLMHAAATSRGEQYFHFLQPNQYVEGSKPNMSELEKKIAFVEHGYGSVYRVAYPFIQKKSPWFKRNNIPYFDLTYLFQNIKQQIYIDNCCHMHPRGSDLVVQTIVDTIHQQNVLNKIVSN